ncbi:Peptidase S10, serine carboxypeptidase [Dillenia turbinata]|uniref:Carboxypeptidase n=1 Tax=Dillenia turbinata TaxID=194707 RepID=A0AAN8ZLN7_9MAGN
MYVYPKPKFRSPFSRIKAHSQFSSKPKCKPTINLRNFRNVVPFLLNKVSKIHISKPASAKSEYSPVYVGSQDGLKKADEIQRLPGQPNGVDFDQYQAMSRGKYTLPGISSSGFSSSDHVLSGDKRTAEDSYAFLINWLERFPEYKTQDFFLTGESYAGHYTPQLAQLILRNNKITNQTIITLRGIAIDEETGLKRTFDFLWSHALISDEVYERSKKECNFSSQEMDSWASFLNLPPSFDPCTENYVLNYLNTAAVQNALHANLTELPQKYIPHKYCNSPFRVIWDSCSSLMYSLWIDSPATVLPTIQELMASDIKWRHHARAPVTLTRLSINKLKPPTITSWYPWYTQDEVGGYTVGYQNLTFVTVRGEGHFLPSHQPARALTLFTSFLEGKLPPA